MGEVIWTGSNADEAVELELVKDGNTPVGLLLLLDGEFKKVYQKGDALFRDMGISSTIYATFHGTRIPVSEQDVRYIKSEIADLFPDWAEEVKSSPVDDNAAAADFIDGSAVDEIVLMLDPEPRLSKWARQLLKLLRILRWT
ncbi:MAG TPA: hypothetical protein V6D29_12305 [Leptolyngbyaceae cyanobacterium]